MFNANVKLCRFLFCMGKSEKINFAETIAAFDLKVDRCTELNK